MRIAVQNGLRLAAVYGCLGEQVRDNRLDLPELFGSRGEQLLRGSGINRRSIARRGTSSLDLCVAAAKAVLADMAYDPAGIVGLVSVSFTPDRPLPGNAAPAQALLGLCEDVATIDLHAHCAGYPYGLWVAGSLALALGGDVLLLCGDVQSPLVSPQDAATYPLFADAGTASLVSIAGDDCWSYAFYNDGSRRDALQIPAGGSASPLREENLRLQERSEGSLSREIDIAMDGLAIYRFVIQDVCNFIADYLRQKGRSPQAYANFIPHQANMKLVPQMAVKAGFDAGQLWLSGEEYGNVAAASLPLTIAHCGPDRLHESELSLLAGFGAGLSASLVELTLHPATLYKVIMHSS